MITRLDETFLNLLLSCCGLTGCDIDHGDKDTSSALIKTSEFLHVEVTEPLPAKAFISLLELIHLFLESFTSQ